MLCSIYDTIEESFQTTRYPQLIVYVNDPGMAVHSLTALYLQLTPSNEA